MQARKNKKLKSRNFILVSFFIDSINPLTAAIEVIEDLLKSLSASLNFRFFLSALLFVFLRENR